MSFTEAEQQHKDPLSSENLNLLLDEGYAPESDGIHEIVCNLLMHLHNAEDERWKEWAEDFKYGRNEEM